MPISIYQCFMFQLETEWRENRKQGGLQRLDALAKKELDWNKLNQLADNRVITLFTSKQASNKRN